MKRNAIALEAKLNNVSQEGVELHTCSKLCENKLLESIDRNALEKSMDKVVKMNSNSV